MLARALRKKCCGSPDKHTGELLAGQSVYVNVDFAPRYLTVEKVESRRDSTLPISIFILFFQFLISARRFLRWLHTIYKSAVKVFYL